MPQQFNGIIVLIVPGPQTVHTPSPLAYLPSRSMDIVGWLFSTGLVYCGDCTSLHPDPQEVMAAVRRIGCGDMACNNCYETLGRS